jgi:hypothetical protein
MILGLAPNKYHSDRDRTNPPTNIPSTPHTSHCSRHHRMAHTHTHTNTHCSVTAQFDARSTISSFVDVLALSSSYCRHDQKINAETCAPLRSLSRSLFVAHAGNEKAASGCTPPMHAWAHPPRAMDGPGCAVTCFKDRKRVRRVHRRNLGSVVLSRYWTLHSCLLAGFSIFTKRCAATQ